MKKYSALIIFCLSMILVSCGADELKDRSEVVSEAVEVVSEDNLEKEKQNIIKIYSIEENAMIQETIELFRRKYPDVGVEYQTGNSELSQSVLEEMREGKGPDIIMLDSIMERDLLREDILLDLTDTLDLESNITLFKEKQNPYVIPLRFAVPFLFTDYEGRSLTINQIAAETGKFNVSDFTYEELISLLYLYYDNDLVNDDYSVNEANLTDFLKDVIKIAKKQNIVDEKKVQDEFSMIRKYLTGNNTVMYHMALGIDDVKYYFSATIEKRGMARVVQDSVYPCNRIAINKNSICAQECINFIQLALSYDIQILDFGNGFPVNEKALDEWANAYIARESKISLGVEEGVVLEIEDPPEEEMKFMIILIKEKPSFYKRDMDLLRIIQEESKKCYNNEGNLNQIIESTIDKYTEFVGM